MVGISIKLPLGVVFTLVLLRLIPITATGIDVTVNIQIAVLFPSAVVAGISVLPEDTAVTISLELTTATN